MNKLLTITKSAGKKLIDMSKQHETNNILFYVKGGGCNGMKYFIDSTNKPPTVMDEQINIDDTNIIICGKNLQ